jgi:Na+/H+-dicarboxylate symporter
VAEEQHMSKKLPLHTKILIGMLIGVVYAFLSVQMGWNEFTITWIDPFGTMFIRMLKFIALPLVLFSIISGVASLPDPSKLGRLGLKSIGAYLLTTFFAVSLGLILVNVIQPGKYISEDQRILNRLKYEIWASETPGIEAPSGGFRFLNNPAYESAKAEAVLDLAEEGAGEQSQKTQSKKDSPLQFLVNMIPEPMGNSGTMLQVIFFGIFFGIVILLEPAGITDPVVRFVNSANHLFIRMVEIIMDAAPFFVFALLAGVLAKMSDTTAGIIDIFLSLLSYALVVAGGLGLMVFFFYPMAIVLSIKNISLRQFYRAVSPAQLLAFSTSSSAATLPVTLECVTNNLKVPERVANFTLPIGATINMDGTSMYQAIAVVFLAQLHLIDLSFAQNLTILVTATLASIGTAAVPSAGLVMMIIVLNAVGLNPAWIAIIIPIDRLLDMCRTVVNVTGDMTVAAIIAKSEGEMNVVDDDALKEDKL